MCNKFKKILLLTTDSKVYKMKLALLIFKDIKPFISEYKLDPWLLNKNKQTSFDIINPIPNFNDAYKELLNVWTKRVLNDILLNNTYDTMNNNDNTIFYKIKNNFDEVSSNIYINKISKYI